MVDGESLQQLLCYSLINFDVYNGREHSKKFEACNLMPSLFFFLMEFSIDSYLSSVKSDTFRWQEPSGLLLFVRTLNWRKRLKNVSSLSVSIRPISSTIYYLNLRFYIILGVLSHLCYRKSQITYFAIYKQTNKMPEVFECWLCTLYLFVHDFSILTNILHQQIQELLKVARQVLFIHDSCPT